MRLRVLDGYDEPVPLAVDRDGHLYGQNSEGEWLPVRIVSVTVTDGPVPAEARIEAAVELRQNEPDPEADESDDDEPHSYAVDAMLAGASHEDVMLAMCRDLDESGAEVPESIRLLNEAALRTILKGNFGRSFVLDALMAGRLDPKDARLWSGVRISEMLTEDEAIERIGASISRAPSELAAVRDLIREGRVALGAACSDPPCRKGATCAAHLGILPDGGE